jgi:hypothetical protein
MRKYGEPFLCVAGISDQQLDIQAEEFRAGSRFRLFCFDFTEPANKRCKPIFAVSQLH